MKDIADSMVCNNNIKGSVGDKIVKQNNSNSMERNENEEEEDQEMVIQVVVLSWIDGGCSVLIAPLCINRHLTAVYI